MSAEPPQLDSQNARTPASTVPLVLRILAMILRALFLAALIVIVARVSSPQSETIWAAYETPGDLIRLALGFAACVWLVIHIFMLPKDAEGYKTWLYFGPVSVPIGWVIAVAKW
jgi:TRAP-type C4-dicarboxylate transport system permease small subunit